MPIRYWILLFVLGIGFGSAFFFNEILLREVGPLTISAARVALGAAFAWVFLAATGPLKPVGAGRMGALLVQGLVNYAMPFAALAGAQPALTGGVTGITNAMTPVMVVLLSQIWIGGERAGVMKFAGVAAGFAGIVVMALPMIESGFGAEFWAILLAMLAPLGYAMGALNVSRFRDMDPGLMTGFSLTGAAMVMVPMALAREGAPSIEHGATWASLAFVGFILTGAAFMALFWLIARVGPTVGSTVTFVAPMSAVVLGIAILGEPFEMNHALGMVAIFAGLAQIDGRLPRMLGNWIAEFGSRGGAPTTQA